MVSLELKLKLPKTCEKRLHKLIRVVLCKKRPKKRPKIRKITTFPKVAKSAILQNRQFGAKIKIDENVRETTV